MNAHVSITTVDKRQAIEDAGHDLLMRCEIALTLAEGCWSNLQAMERITGGPLMTESGLKELDFQLREVRKAARALQSEIAA